MKLLKERSLSSNDRRIPLNALFTLSKKYNRFGESDLEEYANEFIAKIKYKIDLHAAFNAFQNQKAASCFVYRCNAESLCYWILVLYQSYPMLFDPQVKRYGSSYLYNLVKSNFAHKSIPKKGKRDFWRLKRISIPVYIKEPNLSFDKNIRVISRMVGGREGHLCRKGCIY